MRSFARRVGKSMSDRKKSLLNQKLHEFLFDLKGSDSTYLKYDSRCLEIGFGTGENILLQASHNPTDLYIGLEPYMNGVVSLLDNIINLDINNIRIWPDDCDMVLKNLLDASVKEIFILFPDPWPKLRQQKRRFLNDSRFCVLYSKLIVGGKLYFASDIESYSASLLEILEKYSQFLDFDIQDTPKFIYRQTKYHRKAIKEGREVKFITITRKSQDSID